MNYGFFLFPMCFHQVLNMSLPLTQVPNRFLTCSLSSHLFPDMYPIAPHFVTFGICCLTLSYWNPSFNAKFHDVVNFLKFFDDKFNDFYDFQKFKKNSLIIF